MNSALNVKNLVFGYPGLPPVLQNINFTIETGEKVGFIGPNGAGKTTLFLLICGVIKQSGGAIEIMGAPVLKGSFNPEVGMVFQHTNDQLINPSVREDIAFGPQNMGYSKKEVNECVRSAVEKTGIERLLDRVPHQLSSGEQRLVALAGILAMNPRILIMDEPTSDLDLRYRRRLINLLNDMKEKTMLVASHDLEFLLETCNRVFLLEKGLIQSDGNPVTIMADKVLMETHGLEVPHSLSATWHRHLKE